MASGYSAGQTYWRPQGSGAPVWNAGYDQLYNMLMTGGQPGTDARQLQDIWGQTARQTGDFESQLARSGMSGSGVGKALLSSIRTSGTNRIARQRSANQSRRLQMLQLLRQLLIDPLAANLDRGIR